MTAYDKNLHFLVVDDDEDSRKTIVEYLRSMGFEKISQAKDGAEAALVLDRDPTINFIISDWDMPLMNGLSLLQRVRSSPLKAQIPFLIATSPVSEEAEKVVLAAESLVNAYVIKPFRSQTLREKIDKLLELSVHGPQKQVLVIDDDTDSRQMIVEYVQQLGFKDVHSVADGKTGLEYLTQNVGKVGLIISDWEMPEMSGLELLRACKAQPLFAEVPFLMVTSQTSMERMKIMQAAKANVDQYLLKPFGLSDLKKRIDTLLEKARSRREVEALLAEAAEHLEYGRHQKAQECYEQALRFDPNHDAALRGLGDTLFRTKGADSALPYYKKAVESSPYHPKGYLRLASAYEQIGMVDKAISLLQMAVSQISFIADLHFQLGRLYNKKGMLVEARAEFEKTLEIQLDHKEARVMLEMMGVSRS